MKRTEDFIREMEESNIMMNKEVTFKEYANELLKFQKLICKMIAGDDYCETMRMSDALAIMENKALEMEMRNHPSVHKGIVAMTNLCKEIAITMSGAKGESLVSKTLEYLNRPNTKIYNNVYVSSDEKESELDSVVLTDSGIIILEVKKASASITLTDDGKLVLGEGECYDKTPLGEKMVTKRALLKENIEKALALENFDIPLNIDSYIVFSTPKGQYIKLDDKYRKEKFCFRLALNQRIENYDSEIHYSGEQLNKLDSILNAIKTNEKRFTTDLDYDEIRRSLAEAMYILQNQPKEVAVEKTVDETTSKQKATKNNMVSEKAKIKSKKSNVSNGLEYIAVGAIASIVGIALLLKSSPKRA